MFVGPAASPSHRFYWQQSRYVTPRLFQAGLEESEFVRV